MSLSIVNHPYVDFCVSVICSQSRLWSHEQLASMVQTEAMGVVHIYKCNPNCVSKTLCCKTWLNPYWEPPWDVFVATTLNCATMRNMQITSPLET